MGQRDAATESNFERIPLEEHNGRGLIGNPFELQARPQEYGLDSVFSFHDGPNRLLVCEWKQNRFAVRLDIGEY